MKKYYILSFSLLLLYFNSVGQQWNWAKQLSYPGSATGISMDKDPSGNIYLATGDGAAGSILSGRDATGNVNWSKAISGNITKLAVGSGHIAFCGSFSGTLTIDGTTITSTNVDGFIAFCDMGGNLQWLRQVTGPRNEWVNSVKLNGAEDVFVQVTCDSNSTCAGASFTRGMPVCVFNSAGTLTDSWQVASAYDLYSQELAIDNVDNIFIKAVYFDSVLTVGGIAVVNNDTHYGSYFLARLSRGGSVYWAQDRGSQFRRRFGNLAVSAAGELYLTVQVIYEEEHLVKMSPAGTTMWNKVFGANTYDGLRSLQFDTDQSLYVTGKTWGSASFGACTETGTDYFLVIARVDSAGNCTWSDMAQGTTASSGITLSVKGSEGTFVGFSAYGDTIMLGTIPMDGYFIAGFEKGPAALGVEAASKNRSLSIFPNPSAGVFSFSTPEAANAIGIYDMLGNCVHTQQLSGKIIETMDLSYLPKGIYVARLAEKDGMYSSGRIVIR